MNKPKLYEPGADPESEPVLLQHMPREVALELDRLYGLVRTGYLGVHKNDGEWVKFDHRVTEGRDRFQKRKKAGR